ncbi:MAG: class I SAM-dependent methyltransferase [Candidatus Hodarchaeota archaeon]
MSLFIDLMYERLADFFLENLNLSVSTILEVGCGMGSLTIPLARKIAKYTDKPRIIALDLSYGPYAGILDVLRKKVNETSLENKIDVVQNDVRNMTSISNESIDLIISSELLCDLDRDGLEMASKEFYRILKPGGQMGHGELNPIPANKAQQLFIDADKHSLETATPKPQWFSPCADEVAIILHKTGFRNIFVKYFDPKISLPFEEAKLMLKKWNVDLDFIKKHDRELRKHGIEFPLEHVIFCNK